MSSGQDDGFDNGWDSPMEGFEIDATDVDVDELKKGGWVDTPGKYHWTCEEAEHKTDRKSPYIKYTMVVLKTVAGQSPEGSRHTEDVYLSGAEGSPLKQGSIDGMVAMLLGFGILVEQNRNGKNVAINPRTGNSKFGMPELMAIKGRQCCSGLQYEKQQEGSTYAPKLKVPYKGFLRLDDPRAAGIPKNAEAVKLAVLGGYCDASKVEYPETVAAKGKPAGKPGGNGSAQPKSDPAPAPAPVPTSAVDDPDL